MARSEKDAAYVREYNRKRVEFKRQLLAQFPCALCKESDPDLIDWHHVNPEEKSFGLTGKARSNEDLWWNEVLKCIPVCVLCHRKIHQEKLCLLPPWPLKKSHTESKPQVATESTCAPDCTCPVSQPCSQPPNQINPKPA